jgi:hypothetical protein
MYSIKAAHCSIPKQTRQILEITIETVENRDKWKWVADAIDFAANNLKTSSSLFFPFSSFAFFSCDS